MRPSSSSSIRVSARTRKRVSGLARRLRAASHQEVIDKALDALEHIQFWAGFDEEARAYLKAHPGENSERERFGQVSDDGLQR